MIYQWLIFLAQLADPGGASEAALWPVLVVSRERVNQVLPLVNVVPLIWAREPSRAMAPNEVLLPTWVSGLEQEAIALCYQVRPLAKERLRSQAGQVGEFGFREQINAALRFQLAL